MRNIQIWKNLRKCKHHYGINEDTTKESGKLDKIKHDRKTKSIHIMMEKKQRNNKKKY